MANQFSANPVPRHDWLTCLRKYGLFDFSQRPPQIKGLTKAEERVLGLLYQLMLDGKGTAGRPQVRSQPNTLESLKKKGLIQLLGEKANRLSLTQKGQSAYALFYWYYKLKAGENLDRRPGLNPGSEYLAYKKYLEDQVKTRVSQAKLLECSKEGAPKTGNLKYDRYLSRLPKNLRRIIFANGINPSTVWSEYCRYGRDYIEKLYGEPQENPGKVLNPVPQYSKFRVGALVQLKETGEKDVIAEARASGGIVLENDPAGILRDTSDLLFLEPPLKG